MDMWKADELQPPKTLGASVTDLAISPGEGMEVFSRLLPRIGFPHLVVSTAPLQARIDQWVGLVSLREPEQTRRPRGTFYPRPALRVPYVAPTTDVQREMAQVWQRLLAIDEIGINDDFFELGGNSLLGTQLVMEMREAFKISVPLRDFFDTPTVAALSTLVHTAETVKELPKIKPIPRDSMRIPRKALSASRGS